MFFLQAFEKNQYVVGQERKELAKNLNLSETQVRKKVVRDSGQFFSPIFWFSVFFAKFFAFFQIGFWPRSSIIPRLKSCHYDHDHHDHDVGMIILVIIMLRCIVWLTCTTRGQISAGWSSLEVPGHYLALRRQPLKCNGRHYKTL